jgi:hypothetical protein
MSESGVYSKVTDKLVMEDFTVAFTAKSFETQMALNDTSEVAFTAILFDGVPENINKKS